EHKEVGLLFGNYKLKKCSAGIGHQGLGLLKPERGCFTTLRLEFRMSSIETGLKCFKVEAGFLELGVKLPEPIRVCLLALLFSINLGVERNELVVELALLLDLRASHRFGDADTTA